LYKNGLRALQSKRQFLAHSLSCAAASYLLRGDSSWAQSHINYEVRSPANTFVAAVLAKDGDRITNGTEVIEFDTTHLEILVVQKTRELKSRQIRNERLSNQYVNDFIIGPLNSLKEKYDFVLESQEHYLQFIENAFAAGRASVSDFELAHKNHLEAQAALDSVSRRIEKEQISIEAQRSEATSSIDGLNKEIVSIVDQIARCRVVAPLDGRLSLDILAGVFVERGDLLFSIN
jgi:multidrug resistance efflux pump